MLMPYVFHFSSLYLAFMGGSDEEGGLTLLQVLLVNTRRTYPFHQ